MPKRSPEEAVTVKIITQFPDKLCQEAAVLYCEADWISGVEEGGFLKKALPGSCAVAGAFEGDKLIGIARALSDGVSDAYIQDVTVDKSYRGRGIGGKLVKLLASELADRGIDWIGLVGVPGTEKFYSSLGFVPQGGHTLWLKKDE
ncbi:MAG: GNAT family N-acetyltransferase [Lentisphaeria bacterium]|nr:GNAT family N-acetyltransferase [Lentisphaeria bacterium]